jgi:hypothetical protein
VSERLVPPAEVRDYGGVKLKRRRFKLELPAGIRLMNELYSLRRQLLESNPTNNGFFWNYPGIFHWMV